MSSRRPSAGTNEENFKVKMNAQHKIKYRLIAGNSKRLPGKVLNETNIKQSDAVNNSYKKPSAVYKQKRHSYNDIKAEHRHSSVDVLLKKVSIFSFRRKHSSHITPRTKRAQINQILEDILKKTKRKQSFMRRCKETDSRDNSIVRGNYNIINVSIHQNIKNICCTSANARRMSESKGHSRKDSFSSIRKAKLDFSKPRASLERDSCGKSLREESFVEERTKLVGGNREWLKSHSEPPTTTLEHYYFVKLIGKGAFGKVILGIHILTGKYVAIKAIDKKYMRDKFSRHKVFQEVYILKKVRHANVIRLLEVFEDSDRMLIVMEYAAGGDLLRCVRTKGALEESKVRRVFRQVVYGLGHIHARGVLHRDIKLDNILLDAEGNVKICDFGVSRIVGADEVVKEQCGTPAYIAPEIIGNGGYKGFYTDHWSLGVLLYAMLTASVPFRASNMQELLEVIMERRISFPLGMSRLAMDLIKSLLKINPAERLSIPEILEHPWMKEELHSEECDYITIKDCEQNLLGIDAVDVSKLFFRERKVERLSYVDHCIIANDLHTHKIDEDVLKVMSKFGYPRKIVIEGLEKKLLNHATATYNLLVLA
eukprot:TRINITY_DN16103_c0_g1_i4.p1 TRINITY_DN16103_c0_g1~~TRINITY_DN16103_c0_g1_i4.p1  ORF type:complete len:596 (+),score=110.14 TRINITY_DN16103_c0_g1_i4:291-2078(+)